MQTNLKGFSALKYEDEFIYYRALLIMSATEVLQNFVSLFLFIICGTGPILRINCIHIAKPDFGILFILKP